MEEEEELLESICVCLKKGTKNENLIISIVKEINMMIRKWRIERKRKGNEGKRD